MAPLSLIRDRLSMRCILGLVLVAFAGCAPARTPEPEHEGVQRVFAHVRGIT